MPSDQQPTFSVLFDRPPPATDPAREPACFADLHLDEIVGWLTAGREEYELAPLLRQPLADPESVRYRQSVFRDLEHEDVRAAIQAFAERMRLMRRHLALAGRLHYGRQRQRWFLEGVIVYCDAVERLCAELGQLELKSDGLSRLGAHVDRLTCSDAFRGLRREALDVARSLAEVRYLIHLKGLQVKVRAAEELPDLSSEVAETFAKFAQGAVKDYRTAFKERPELNHVEAQILDGVAALHPDAFGSLERFCATRRGYLDAGLARFDREVQVYLSYLELIGPLRKAGLPFTEARVTGDSGKVDAHGTFDLALARKLTANGGQIVRNDVRLDPGERVIVVTGPNNGGKTTFARAFGQLHYLASLGLPVPGASAELRLADRIFTHFEREEELVNLRGKFEDELVRIRQILDDATADSVLILNETFGSTTLRDAELVGARVLEQIVDLGARCVFVTFVDELAATGDSVVSMTSTVSPEDPAVRTYRVVRRPADGLAYAAAIADKYRLGYAALRRRISR